MEKLIFLKDHSPRKKGETFEVRTRDEKRTAEWYIANGIAKWCECKKGTKSGCADCDQKANEPKGAPEAKESNPKGLASLKMQQLVAIAAKKGIKHPAVIKKDTLIAMIEEADVPAAQNTEPANEPAENQEAEGNKEA
jgi:hypothetical protein